MTACQVAANPPFANVRSWRRIQPVNATHSLNISAGASQRTVASQLATLRLGPLQGWVATPG